METMDQLVEVFAGDTDCYGCEGALTSRFYLEKHYCCECLGLARVRLYS